MKAKIFSWLLASAWLAWGICLLLSVPGIQGLYSGFGFSAPSILRVMFIAGPFGCLLIAAVIGAFVALNAHKFHVRFVSLTLTITLVAWVGYVTNVVFTTFSNQMA